MCEKIALSIDIQDTPSSYDTFNSQSDIKISKVIQKYFRNNNANCKIENYEVLYNYQIVIDLNKTIEEFKKENSLFQDTNQEDFILLIDKRQKKLDPQEDQKVPKTQLSDFQNIVTDNRQTAIMEKDFSNIRYFTKNQKIKFSLNLMAPLDAKPEQLIFDPEKVTIQRIVCGDYAILLASDRLGFGLVISSNKKNIYWYTFDIEN